MHAKTLKITNVQCVIFDGIAAVRLTTGGIQTRQPELFGMKLINAGRIMTLRLPQRAGGRRRRDACSQLTFIVCVLVR